MTINQTATSNSSSLTCTVLGDRNETGRANVLLVCGRTRLLIDDVVPVVAEGLPFYRIPHYDGCLLSRAPLDAWNDLGRLDPDTVVLSSDDMKGLVEEAACRTSHALPSNEWHTTKPGAPLDLGPFRITPLPGDSTSRDGTAYLIEASCKRILYTGVLLIQDPKTRRWGALADLAPIDLLVCEGAHVDSGFAQLLSRLKPRAILPIHTTDASWFADFDVPVLDGRWEG